MLNKFKAWVVFAGTVSLVACGGSGGGSGGGGRDVAPERPVSSVTGIAFDGLCISCDVKIFDFTGGVKGAVLGSGKTDGQGQYSVSLSASSRPVLIQVGDGGYYLEEATGVQIQVDRSQGHKLLAVEYYESGKAIEVSATFFTTIATGLSECLIQRGMSAESAIEKAYSEMDAWAGFNVRKTVPLSVDDSANVTPYLTDRHRYGFVSGALSELTRVVGVQTGNGEHNDFSSIAFISTAAYVDVHRDCALDGKDNNNAVVFGNLVVNANTYRDLLALRLLQFVKGIRNATGLSFDELLPFASSLNLYSGELFNYVAAPDITESKPSVSQFLPAEGAVIAKSYTASAVVSDDYGLESVKYYIDGMFVAGASNPENPVRLIDTLNFTNGAHAIKIVVTNVMGNSVAETHNIIINNGTLALSFNVAEYVENPTTYNPAVPCTASFKITDTTNQGIDWVKNGQSLIASDVDSTPLGFQLVIPFEGSTRNEFLCSSYQLAARDKIGNLYDMPFTVRHRYMSGASTSYYCSFSTGSC